MTPQKKPKAKVNYVNNRDFYEAILKHREKAKECEAKGLPEPILSDYIGDCILKIAQKLATKPCFTNYSFKEEMVSDAIENCFMYFKDFDPDKTENPFSYFTQVVYYAFLRRIYKEEKNRYTKYKNLQHSIIHGTVYSGQLSDNGVSSEFMLFDDDNNSLLTPKMYDNINEFMEKFERKEKEKKIKRKQMKGNLSYFEE